MGVNSARHSGELGALQASASGRSLTRNHRIRLSAKWSGAALRKDDMAEKFRALLVTKDGDRQSVAVTELTDADLMVGDVTVAVEHSTVNYKDGLAITGKAPIIRKFPLIPGIDLAGKVLHSEDPHFQAGDRVVLNGYGLGELHHGGYAERARVKSDWLIRLPENISTAEAMAIGTAGYTAMLCVLALETAGITPDRGDVLVTGAAGGVGSVAIALLDKLGYRVVASSRRAEQEGDYLQGLGADETINASELSGAGVPLAKERWAGAIQLARQSDAGQRALADQIRRRRSRLRLGTRVGPARDRPALHPTRRDARGRELGLDPPRQARRGLGSTGIGSRSRKAQQHDVTCENSMMCRLWRPKSSREKREDGWSSISEHRSWCASANIGRYYLLDRFRLILSLEQPRLDLGYRKGTGMSSRREADAPPTLEAGSYCIT